MATAKKYYSITYKKRGSDNVQRGGEYGTSAAEAKEKFKSRMGDIKIISCVAAG